MPIDSTPISGHFWGKYCSLLFLLSHQVLTHGDEVSLNFLPSKLKSWLSQPLTKCAPSHHDLCGPMLDSSWYVYDCPVLVSSGLVPAPTYVLWALSKGKYHLLDLLAVLSLVQHPKGAVGHLHCSGTFLTFSGMPLHAVISKKWCLGF